MTQLSSLKSNLKINLPQKINYKVILNINPLLLNLLCFVNLCIIVIIENFDFFFIGTRSVIMYRKLQK